ncbi:MAG: hypothetical protein N3D12_06670, partial [Candidatus Methanomethyliaceae archaeon]|nr:hypothetical protein [Candidatus Methanomethyliaceae archaeon]
FEANYQQFMRRLCDMWSQDNIQVVHQTEGNLWTECPEKCSSLPIVDFDDWNGEKNVIVRAKIEQCDEYFAGEYPAGFLVLKEEEEEEEEEEVLE